MNELLKMIGLVFVAVGLRILQSVAFAIILAVLHVLEMAAAMHTLGWSAHGLVIVCLAYGAAVFFAIRRAVP